MTNKEAAKQLNDWAVGEIGATVDARNVFRSGKNWVTRVDGRDLELHTRGEDAGRITFEDVVA